jgi:hypothetical protein
MRTREERLTFELSSILERIDMDMQKLQQAIATQEKVLSGLAQMTSSSTQASDETRGVVDGVGKTITGETRSMREQLAAITQRIQVIDVRLTAIESANAGLLAQVDARMKALSAQITSTVVAVVVIVAGTALVMLLSR